MDAIEEMARAIYRGKVERARRMDGIEKLLAPARLYEHARKIAMAGIRRQHPEATEEEVRAMFRERLRVKRELERGMEAGGRGW